MTIQRSARRKNYALIDQKIFEDDRLDHKLLGILTYLLSKPDNWTTNSRQLAKRFNAAIDTIKKHLAQLEEIGYLERIRAKNELGQFTWTTIVHESPIVQSTMVGKTIDGKTSAGKTSAGKTSAGKTVDITNNEVTITELINTDQQQEADADFSEKPEEPFYNGQARHLARELVKVSRQMVGPKNFITDAPWGKLADELGKDPQSVWNEFQQYMIALNQDKKDPANYVGKVCSEIYQNPGSELNCKAWMEFSDHFRKKLSAPPPPKTKVPKQPIIEPLPDREESAKAIRAAREQFNQAIGRQE